MKYVLNSKIRHKSYYHEHSSPLALQRMWLY